MQGEQFEQFCREIEAGRTKYVENTGSHERGRVLFCSGNRLEVEIDNRRETWGIEFCREVGPA